MPSAIVCDNLSKTYGKQTRGISDINFTVERGEVMGFLGTNGAGKTTTLRCLVGLLRPTSGSASVLGLDPSSDRKELMAKIGYLPGELRLYEDLTGAEHLEFLANVQQHPTPQRSVLCERMSLNARDLKRPIREYSRGMKQKIGIVQAFQHEPEVVFLDEPSEGLDPLVQESFFELLAETSASGRTVFLSSHVMSEVQRACSRVAIVKAGQLVTVSKVDDLRSAHSRRIRLVFDDDFDKSRVAAEEYWQPQWRNNELLLSVEATKVVEVLRSMLIHPVQDVTVEEASLDEVVLALYRAETSS